MAPNRSFVKQWLQVALDEFQETLTDVVQASSGQAQCLSWRKEGSIWGVALNRHGVSNSKANRISLRNAFKNNSLFKELLAGETSIVSSDNTFVSDDQEVLAVRDDLSLDHEALTTPLVISSAATQDLQASHKVIRNQSCSDLFTDNVILAPASEQVVETQVKRRCISTCDDADNSNNMLQCDECSIWFHSSCIGEDFEFLKNTSPFYCPVCKQISSNSSLSSSFSLHRSTQHDTSTPSRATSTPIIRHTEKLKNATITFGLRRLEAIFDEVKEHIPALKSTHILQSVDPVVIHVPPTEFTVTLTGAEWLSMKPAELDEFKKTRTLRKKVWTEIMDAKFREVNNLCVLKFEHHHVTSANSRKTSACFFKATATCKHLTCYDFEFKIQSEPEDGCKEVIVAVKSFGTLDHEENACYARHLKGVKRSQAKKEIKYRSPSAYLTEVYDKVDPRKLVMRNSSDTKQLMVYQKIKSEVNNEGDFDEDYFQDLRLTKKDMDMKCTNNKVKGYIQKLTFDPLSVVMFTEQQLNLVNTLNTILENNLVLYLDATGSLIKKPQEVKKAIFYYALAVRHPLESSPLPVAEMMSNDHTIPSITHFLDLFRRAYKQIYNKEVPVKRIEMDFSWAMINSSLRSFAVMTVSGYIQRCWEVQDTNADLPTVVVHICAAHMIHAASRNLYKICNKNVKKFYQYIFANLQNTTNLKVAGKIAKNMFIVANSNYRTDKVNSAIEQLRSLFVSIPEIEDENEDEQLGEEVPDDECVNKDTIKGSSEFYHYFLKMKRRAENTVQADQAVAPFTPNQYFCPDAATCILENYLGYYPLWSGLMLDENNTRDTNNTVENWFKIVKKDEFQSRNNIKIGRVVRQLADMMKGRIKRYCHEYSAPAIPKKKRKRDLDLSEEKWGKSMKSSKTKGYYNREAAAQFLNEELPFPLMPWGGTWMLTETASG